MDKDKKNKDCNYELLNGNCLNLLKMIPDNSVDMVLCDLPYGLTNETWDSVIPMNDFIVFNNKNLEFTDLAFLQYKNNVSFEKTACCYCCEDIEQFIQTSFVNAKG